MAFDQDTRKENYNDNFISIKSNVYKLIYQQIALAKLYTEDFSHILSIT